MSLGWSDLTPEGKKYFAELQKLANLEVVVGFQEGEKHVGKDGEEDEATLAEIAAYNELGSSTVPSRPFMKQSFEKHQDGLQKACDQVNAMMSRGEATEKALGNLGVYLKGLVQDEIVDGNFAPNSPVTIARKGSATPLVDSGYMRQHVSYVIRTRKG